MRRFGSSRKTRKRRARRTTDNFRESILKVGAGALASSSGRMRHLSIMGIFVMLAAGALCLVYLGGIAVGGWMFSSNDLFGLHNVDIRIRGDVISADLVRNWRGLKNCSNVFDIDIASYRKSFMDAYPWVRSMKIERKLPGTLSIEIEERVPVARLEMPGCFLVVDRDSRVLGAWRGSNNLPVIWGHCIKGVRPGLSLKGTAVMDAVEIVDVCQSTPLLEDISIRSIDVRERDALLICLEDGEKVKFAWDGQGEISSVSRKNLLDRLVLLDSNRKEIVGSGKKLESIDMTLNNNFPARITDLSDQP